MAGRGLSGLWNGCGETLRALRALVLVALPLLVVVIAVADSGRAGDVVGELSILGMVILMMKMPTTTKQHSLLTCCSAASSV